MRPAARRPAADPKAECPGQWRRTGDYFYKEWETGIVLVVLTLSNAEDAGTPLGDRSDMVYMNTNVTRGAGEFVVTATGMATEVGLVMGVGTLGVISWAEQARGQDIAHTMGVVTFSLYALFFSIAPEIRKAVRRRTAAQAEAVPAEPPMPSPAEAGA